MSLTAVASAVAASVVVALAGVSAGGAAGVGDCTPGSNWPAAHPDVEAAVLSLVNAHRASLSLPPLTTSPALQASAEWKARHMAQYGDFDHDDAAPPVSRTFADRIAACGYTAPAGENLARWFPSPAAVVAAWLGDPAHKANLEGAAWHATGIGVAVSAAGIAYWAEDFGAAASPAAPPPPPQKAAAACVVPSVLRRTQAVAVRRIRAGGCRAQVRAAHSRGVARGHVAWQSPRAHVRMPLGSVVVVAVRA
jgi:uncharacterized protein YkwD